MQIFLSRKFCAAIAIWNDRQSFTIFFGSDDFHIGGCSRHLSMVRLYKNRIKSSRSQIRECVRSSPTAGNGHHVIEIIFIWHVSNLDVKARDITLAFDDL